MAQQWSKQTINGGISLKVTNALTFTTLHVLVWWNIEFTGKLPHPTARNSRWDPNWGNQTLTTTWICLMKMIHNNIKSLRMWITGICLPTSEENVHRKVKRMTWKSAEMQVDSSISGPSWRWLLNFLGVKESGTGLRNFIFDKCKWPIPYKL